jgi:nucleoside-diphosphate-sugar epimerase
MTKLSPIILEDLNLIIDTDIPWQELFNKSILITGANGFLPAYIVRTLLLLNDKKKANIKVIGVVRNLKNAKKRFGNDIYRSDFLLINDDINSELKINNNIDFIIHAASQASPKYYGIDPVGTFAANTIGTYNLLNLAVKKQIKKFLYFSSSEVYGSVYNQESISENDFGIIDPTNVRSCYSESKRMGETMCISFAHQFNLPVSIVRPFHTYGPGLSLDDGRVFADFVSNVIRNENIIMNSDGSDIRSFCYLADATKGFFTVLLKGENATAYNVGNPSGETSIKDLAQLLVGLFPERNLQVEINLQKGENYIKTTFNKLSPEIEKIKLLGWKPTTSISEGFKRTILSFL